MLNQCLAGTFSSPNWVHRFPLFKCIYSGLEVRMTCRSSINALMPSAAHPEPTGIPAQLQRLSCTMETEGLLKCDLSIRLQLLVSFDKARSLSPEASFLSHEWLFYIFPSHRPPFLLSMHVLWWSPPQAASGGVFVPDGAGTNRSQVASAKNCFFIHGASPKK